MEKRLILAVLLMGAVILLSNLLFPPPEPAPTRPAAVRAGVSAPAAARVPRPAPAAVAAQPVEVRSPLYRYVFSTRGAALTRAELLEYPSYSQTGPVQLVPEGTTNFLSHRLVVRGDTVDLGALPFRVSAPGLQLREGEAPRQLRFTHDGGGFGVEIVYTFFPDEYRVGVQGRLRGVGQGATLLTELGPGLAPHEEADQRAERELAVVAMREGNVETLRLQELRGTETIPGPLAWAGIKDKYFLAALLAQDGPSFSRVVARDLPNARVVLGTGPERDTLAVPRARVLAALPVGADGSFAFQAYLGPQEHGRLAAVGSGLEEVIPFGYQWLRWLVQPIGGAILWILSGLHDTLGIAYGWVLILFGVMMRVVLWPLNAKAMRAQMKNMAFQPKMQEIREQFKDDPQRQQQEILRLYKEEGFNPVAGCLPMLIPMPVLITLFFVFQSSIEFRGADFLWLSDLSLKDPFYILPVFLVVSMFALQWVSTHMSGMEQNPQMKMMMYVMPPMMGIFFFNLPSGLNLYYASTNVASLPQQLLIARERKRAQEQLKASQPPPKPSGGSGAGRSKRRAKRR